MTIIFLIFFAIICILLGYSIVYERQEASKFWSEYTERKMKRMRKKSNKDEDAQTQNQSEEKNVEIKKEKVLDDSEKNEEESKNA